MAAVLHGLHIGGVVDFNGRNRVVVLDAVHVGETDLIAQGEGADLAEMRLVVVRRDDEIIGAGGAELAAGGNFEFGVAPLAHHRQVDANGGDGDSAHIFVAVQLHHGQLRVKGAIVDGGSRGRALRLFNDFFL